MMPIERLLVGGDHIIKVISPQLDVAKLQCIGELLAVGDLPRRVVVPTNSCGSDAFIGIRLPPAAHPKPSTRHLATDVGFMPKSVAMVARRSGCDCGYG
jgi:hypothetical protein